METRETRLASAWEEIESMDIGDRKRLGELIKAILLEVQNEYPAMLL